MKTLVPHLFHLLKHRPTRIKVVSLLRFLSFLAALVTFYSILFHFIMAWEGRQYSWVTGFYWTLTVMSTLGFGDITFTSDLGRVFSSIVLLSGIVMLLVVFPFTFIEFFYAPWMRAQAEARAPSQLPADTSGHVILTARDAVANALIDRLLKYQYPYVQLVPDLDEALRLYEMGYKVMVGDLDNPETYRRARAENALLVAATATSDRVNTNVAFTVREVTEKPLVIATASQAVSVDILQLAGCNHVLQLSEMMGQALARRVSGGDALAHVIGQFDALRIAEATVGSTWLVGKTLREAELRKRIGINVLGVWERGQFVVATPETRMMPGTVLVLAGSEKAIASYNELQQNQPACMAPVLIIGSGRVGQAAGRALAERGMRYRGVELNPERVRDPEIWVVGDAADLEVLEQAGIRTASAVLVTTHDDDTNIYLTIYCRRLRPDVQIISRARLERNVETLYRAGADFVLSYASMGANAILNLLHRSNILMVAEGLDIFKVRVPKSLVGRTLAEINLPAQTGCTVIALYTNGEMQTNPPVHEPLPQNAHLVLIGHVEAEERFLTRYGKEIT